MNQEKLTKLQNNVRIGGKVREKTEFIEMSMKILLRTLFLPPNGDRTVISTWSTQLCKGLPFLPAQLLKDPEYWFSGDGTGDLALCSLVLCLQSQYVFIVLLDIIILLYLMKLC